MLFDVVEWTIVHRYASVALPDIEIWTVVLRAPCIAVCVRCSGAAEE